jgi:hypothetical protein
MSYLPKVYKKDGGDALVVASGGIAVGVLLNKRTRATTAEVNAGLVLLSALPGYKYRIVDCTLIAVGGAAATATSVDLLATSGGSAVRPIVAAVAALTQSAVVKPNSGNVTVLADGASFVAMDANTSISITKQSAGSNLATATAIDCILSYVIEEA